MFDALCTGRSGLRTPPADHVGRRLAGRGGHRAGHRPDRGAAGHRGTLRRPVRAAGHGGGRRRRRRRAHRGRPGRRPGADRGRRVHPAAAVSRRTRTTRAPGGTAAEPAISPYLLPGMLSNMAAARIAIKYGIRGYSAVLVTACAAGAQSLAEARAADPGRRRGRGGLRQRSRRRCTRPSRPRSPTPGHWPAAGPTRRRPAGRSTSAATVSCSARAACVFVVERSDFAAARGAPGYADVIGWGATHGRVPPDETATGRRGRHRVDAQGHRGRRP